MTNPDLERAQQVLAALNAATPKPLDVAALIAEARKSLPDTARKDDGTVEVPDPELVNTLLARVSQIKAEMKQLAAEEDEIKTFLKELVLAAEDGREEGSVEGLTVHGATVFTFKRTVSRVLNQSQVKAMFPDIPENSELWADQVRRTALIK